uniref:Odv-e56 n=1 Tax=Malacosoma sp. alphabaculovirus TaxID=1881632 RepID=A0A1B1V5M1_9ABAC|nr:odv-e56 [Malacosoma sp. alphabaculovirus]
MSFFTNLRRVNKVYPNNVQFSADNIRIINTTPSGFENVFSAPSVRQIGTDRFVPGYQLPNNQFVSAADVNRVMRNNDVGGIRNIFTGVNNNQIGALGQIRRLDNIPDAGLHASYLRRTNVKQNYPSTNVRNAEGIETVLQQQPRLNQYLQAAKTAGVTLLLSAGVYLVFNAATLVQDIINAINAVGGSYYYRGRDGGDVIETCLLWDRTCVKPNLTDSETQRCALDPILTTNTSALQQICVGFDYEREQSVCRESDPNADPDSRQYLDISDLPPGHSIACVEPYNFGDLIGDLGLDGLLGEEGLVGKSMDASASSSNSLAPLLIIIGVIAFILIAGYFIFKKIMNQQNVTVTAAAPPQPPSAPINLRR